ncbi:MAG: HAMP domain-containing histidine kinase [Lachnospiraceae bacterium]|nr:HAMP domain-containing histidine kinase [Lachnospiraceae bacterium]
MKQKKRRFKIYGLRARLGLSIIVSAVICIFVFFALDKGFEYLFTNHSDDADFERTHFQRQGESLQEYIEENSISSNNLSQLKKWERKQPIILLELYDRDKCIYSSIYDTPISTIVFGKGQGSGSQNNLELQLEDGPVTAYIYSDFTYRSSVIGRFISIVTALLLFIIVFFFNNRKLIRYICRLNEEVQILEGGNLEYIVSEEGNDEITDLARSMNRMRATLHQQIETEQQLHQANRQLVTEMSHDLRTPLTGIMLYLEILRSHRYKSEEELQDYLEKIEAKAQHMKVLSDHLFEYSLQDVPQRQLEPRTMEEAFRQEVDSIQYDLEARGFSVETDLEWKNCYVKVNPEFIHRIFENIVSNIEKYAERTASIRIESLLSDKYCGFSIMNTFTLENPQVESNGVGIESIRNMMKKMKGVFNVEQTDTSFEITLLFPIK